MKNMNRLLSLDIMRGITIAGMILVNNPGSWGNVYAPLRHARWDGLTPTDLVFPFFMFIMGVSMFFSLKKYGFAWTSAGVSKVLKRTVLIFLVGLGLNLFGEILYGDPGWLYNLRILGVMQRLALAYGVGALICLAINHKYLLHVAAGILLFYAALLGLSHSTELWEGNIAAAVDRAVFGASHLYGETLADGTRIAFDPEGLLGTIGSIAHVLLGFYAGKVVDNYRDDRSGMLLKLFLVGTVLLFLGLLLSYGVPINKKLWSSTFVLATCGFGSLFLALLIWLIDIRGKCRWVFFQSFGINPLWLYVQAALLSMLLGSLGLQRLVYQGIEPVLGSYGASLTWAVLFVSINWLPGYLLYRNKIYIKL